MSTNNSEITSINTISEEGPSNGGLVKPKSWQTEAIVVTVISTLCCGSLPSLIMGIIAIVKAGKVDSDFASENMQGAIQNSNSAKNLTIWAGVVAVIWSVLISILYFVIFVVISRRSGSLEHLLNL
jgi:uncharacterized membrane protein